MRVHSANKLMYPLTLTQPVSLEEYQADMDARDDKGYLLDTTEDTYYPPVTDDDGETLDYI